MCRVDGPCNGFPRNTSPPPPAPAVEATSTEPVDDEPSDLELWLTANAGKTVSAADVLTQARIEAGLDPEDLDLFPAMDRWDAPNGTRWQTNQEPPGGAMSGYVVLAVFVGDQADRVGDHVPGEGRIYVLPRAANVKCLRYTFSRVPGSGGHRAEMKMKLFVEELAHELNRMAVVFEVIEDDEEDEDDEEEDDTAEDEGPVSGSQPS